MKLVRYGPIGAERPGLVDAAGQLRDLSAHVRDIDPDTLSTKLDRLKQLDADQLPIVEGSKRLGPPVAGVGKIVCIGLNYVDHAAEAKMKVPSEPLIFMKATTAISGPNDPVMLPKGAAKADWEVELALIIGKQARYVDESAAKDCIAGYCILNDVSERGFQLEHEGQWVKGKSCDSFAPMGPWLVTADEVANPHALDIWLEVNAHRYQQSNTRSTIFTIPYLVSYVSQFMTLMPGDVISTGTPPGVGIGQQPPVFLKSGDVMRLGITALGEQCQRVVAYDG